MDSDSSPCTLLVDNGSHRAESTLSLRRVAKSLSEVLGTQVYPVSLLHSTKVTAEELEGMPAQIFEPFLKAQRAQGVHSFLVVPLFFGHSSAIYDYLPQRVVELSQEWPELEVRVAPSMVNSGDPNERGVADILVELVLSKVRGAELERPAVVLVDHGTPRLAVNKVRNLLADQLRAVLGGSVSAVAASSMGRREGAEYDFNEPLLENLLGTPGFDGDVVLAMLFNSPGRHAGPGGDIAQICAAAEGRCGGLRTYMSDLVGAHSGVTELLARRYEEGLAREPVRAEIAPPG